MGFWDFLIGDTEVSGTPRAMRRGLRRENKRPSSRDIWGSFADAAADIGERVDTGNNRDINITPGSWKNPNIGMQLPWMQGNPVDSGPTTEDILAQLASLQDPSRYMGDRGSLASQAMALASSQYDPQIAEVENAMALANRRAGRNKAELGNMFSSLSSDLQGDIPDIQQMYKQDKAESQSGYNQLQGQIKDQYAQSAAEQEAMMQRLNIEAAAPDILPEQQRDRDYFTQLAAQDAATEQRALGTEERGAVNYTQQGSQIARSEGTSRQADLMTQLSDLLSQYEGQIGGLRSAKQSTYLSSLLGMENDQQTNAIQSAQRDFENYIRMIQLGRDLKKDSSPNAPTSVKSPADVANRVLGMGLPQQNAQRVQDVFMSAISSDPQILGGTGVFGQSLPKEAMAQRVVEAGRQAGMSRPELNALQTVALEYFGRR
jgi:hypothetical protein